MNRRAFIRTLAGGVAAALGTGPAAKAVTRLTPLQCKHRQMAHRSDVWAEIDYWTVTRPVDEHRTCSWRLITVNRSHASGFAVATWVAGKAVAVCRFRGNVDLPDITEQLNEQF